MAATRKDTLEISLPSDTEIRIRRFFAAPPDLVYAATTEAAHLRHWWGGCGEIQLLSCESDLRVGGGYRHVLRDPQGQQFSFYGEYRELVPGQRVVRTFIFEPYSDAEAVETAEYSGADGGTWLTVTIKHKSKEFRDGHFNAGMEQGLRASYDALEALLARLQNGGLS